MINTAVENTVSAVLEAHHQCEPPVDVLSIAVNEGIELVPGIYGEEFSGRIEFHRDVGKFLLFYPDLESAKNRGRVRFSIAHELGHYFMEQHRNLLLGGSSHNSVSGFVCEKGMEREADEFAAALLLPGQALQTQLARRNFMTMSEILKLAEAWQASATSTAIRYAKFAEEACGVVYSRDSRVNYYVASDEAAIRGFKYIPHSLQVPATSVTARVGRQTGIVEGKVSSQLWFPQRSQSQDIWEESIPLGYTGDVLTLLAFESVGDEHEE